MRVEIGIINEVRKIENELNNFDRCLNVLICPKCGSELMRMKLNWFSPEMYECLQCKFTYKRKEEE